MSTGLGLRILYTREWQRIFLDWLKVGIYNWWLVRVGPKNKNIIKGWGG